MKQAVGAVKRNLTGFLLVDKPKGFSSNEVLQQVKKLFKAKKAGHAGSLDPLATGMLLICFGGATKLLQFLLEVDKVYVVTAQLGVVTTTSDAEGSIVKERPVPSLNSKIAEDVLEKFRPLLILQIMVVIVGVVVFTLMPNFITRVMFGASYLASAELLPRFSIFVGMYVLINFMILFFLAVAKTKVVLLLLPAITLQVILISLHHESLVSVVNVNLAISFALLLGVGIYFIKSIKS